MAPPRKSERLARALAEDTAARLEERHINGFVLERLWKLADDSVTYSERDSLRLARLCCRIAFRLGADELRARSFSRLGSALRLANRLDHAESALKIALSAAPAHVKGDVLRRRAVLRMYQGRFGDAHQDAENALEKTSGVEYARALEVSGAAYYYRGLFRDSIQQFGRCLDETHPDDGRYCNAIQNYASSLAKGTDDDREEALELLEVVRTRLKPRHKMARAKLWWTIGLLHSRLGDEVAAWRALDTARRSLVALQAAPEVAAIIADLARVSPRPMAIRQFCYEAGELFTGRHPLRKSLRALARAKKDVIPKAAVALREKAGRLVACPAL